MYILNIQAYIFNMLNVFGREAIRAAHTATPVSQPYKYNSAAKYQTGGVYSNKTINLTHPTILVDNVGAHFTAQYPAIFDKYRITATNITTVHAWFNNPMQFWQNQLHFAIWCATTGCGISSHDHLSTSELTKSLYLFHVYYQIRRILAVIQAPLPQDKAYDQFNNPYNRRAYETICAEFGISPNTDWRRTGTNHGLGIPYGGDNTVKQVSDKLQASNMPSLPWAVLHNNDWSDKLMNFKGGKPYTVSMVIQPADPAWSTFILDHSTGFTRPGVERLNDSIRTYVWSILGAQAQTRTNIIGTGTAFDAQKQFLANTEDAISSPVDLPSAIKRYQDILRYAGSKVDFVFGTGLYMAPSNMQLRIGTMQGYNNEIVIATEKQNLGLNTNINMLVAPPHVPTDTHQPATPHTIDFTSGSTVRKSGTTEKAEAITHNDQKTSLIVGGVAVSLLILWFLR